MVLRASGTRVFLSVLCLTLPGTAVAAQSAPTADQLVGLWRLGSFEHSFQDGTTRQDARTLGYIVYTETGHMCYVSMDPDRPLWGAESTVGLFPTPTPDEALSGFTGLGAYCGTVEVNVDEGFVLHHVEMEKSPNAVGVTRKRFFTFNGPDQIVLRVDPAELAPPRTDVTLVWDRVTR